MGKGEENCRENLEMETEGKRENKRKRNWNGRETEGKIETIYGKANANPHVYLAIIESSFHLHALSNIKEVNIAEVKP